jgi:dienelactone hydrolase
MATKDTALEARRALWRLLGGGPPATARLLSEAPVACDLPDVALHRLCFAALGLGAVPALLSLPARGQAPYPIVLYVHAHGGRHAIGMRELIEGRPALLPEPYAVALAGIGIAALTIDLPCFGARATLDEATTARAFHWRGDTLFGQMLRELHAVVGAIAADPRFRAGRIGAFGLSMGATLAWWLAALDKRIAAVADLCCFADLETLVESGAHALHGPYMVVPGLLPAFRSGAIAGLAAPRPKLVRIGRDDALTPPEAWARGLADLRSAYCAAGAPGCLDARAAPGGHAETAAMRADVLGFFARHLSDGEG